jgi:hypothetical protein
MRVREIKKFYKGLLMN